MKTQGVGFTAQGWYGEKKMMEIDGLSYDAAKHIAQTHASLLGQTGRIMSEAEDYVEVYTAGGQTRRGTFAQTTIVYV